jgi:hypothetical protein
MNFSSKKSFGASGWVKQPTGSSSVNLSVLWVVKSANKIFRSLM